MKRISSNAAGAEPVTHIDDPKRIAFYRGILQQPEPPTTDLIDERERRLLTMIAWDLGSGSTAYSSLDDYYLALWLEEAPRQELVELLELLDEQSSTRSRLSALAPEVPLVPHARYTRGDVLAALAVGTAQSPRRPVKGSRRHRMSDTTRSSSTFRRPRGITRRRRCTGTTRSTVS
jgi:hypothetical protein